MKGNNAVKFFLVLVIIGVLTWICFKGELFGYKIPGASSINFGIDVKGGVHAVLAGKNPNGSDYTPSDKELDTAKRIIGLRLDNKGITERNLYTDNKRRIVVDIPWATNEKNYNPQATIDDAVKTALLTFQEVDENKKDSKGAYLPTGKIIIQGTDVSDASPELNTQSGGYSVSLKLTDSGAKKFGEATARLIGKPIAIFMDNQLISAPVVQSAIPDGNAQITLGGTGDSKAQQAEAKNLADTIRSGALPFKMEAQEVNSISPTLGQNALNISVKAGLVALCIVWAFMLLYYRLPGFIADIALLGHTVIQLLVLSWLNVTNLTLPGIAGIILTIGMGVDANIIIFERIKEELRNGKTLRAAIDVGFKRAFTAILDANMTTLISAVVLWFLGVGTLKGFAYTLGLGVVLSFLTAIVVSRIMLKSIADIDAAKHHWLYGA